MDEVARYNKERWEDLARAGIQWSRPALSLDEASARALVDPEGMMGQVAGKDVLCLAGGGGQQSAAFALLGANVTVLDICDTQLERDRLAATHYGLQVTTIQGDMRDLSPFADAYFDVIYHAHSLSFVPDFRPVFDEVARVLRPGGRYRLSYTNPYYHGILETDWTGEHYALREPCVDGVEVIYADMRWDVENEEGEVLLVEGPREFRHGLSEVITGLAARGFVILGMWEQPQGDLEAPPGTFAHLCAIAPQWLTFWTVYRPDLSP